MNVTVEGDKEYGRTYQRDGATLYELDVRQSVPLALKSPHLFEALCCVSDDEGCFLCIIPARGQ
jgi:hypothetical protein